MPANYQPLSPCLHFGLHQLTHQFCGVDLRVAPVVECKKVAVLGAGGGIGQPLSLLLKMNKSVTQLNLYDIANVRGVAADLSHCNTPVQVSGAAWCACQLRCLQYIML